MILFALMIEAVDLLQIVYLLKFVEWECASTILVKIIYVVKEARAKNADVEIVLKFAG